jgi:8-oxo-dGTP pyrophosphatase MutT (NUDIX family)
MSTTAAVVLIVARNTHTLLRILPTKRLSRPKKNGPGMTKADSNPWDIPGGKLKNGETSEQAMKRELREETGLTLDTATKIGESHIPDCKCAVFVYEVDKELPAKPLDGVSEVAWVPIENASHEAHFRLERALHVTAEILVEPVAKRARIDSV